MRFVKSFVALLLFVFALMVTPTMARAGAPDQQSSKCVSLSREIGNTTPFSEFQAVVQSDGLKVSGQGRVSPKASARQLNWAIDPQSCTYQAEWTAIKNKPDILNKAQQAATNSTWFAGLQVVTRDPPGFELAVTTNELSWWTSYPEGFVWLSGWNKACWAANPSEAGTHWYQDLCLRGTPYYGSSHQVIYSATGNGNYHNYDFLLPNLATYAYHSSSISGYNDGWWDYNWSADHTGEAAYLLSGVVYEY